MPGGMRLLCGFYAGFMRVVCGWYAGGMRVVCGWYAAAMRLLCRWYAAAMPVVCGCYAGGMRLLCGELRRPSPGVVDSGRRPGAAMLVVCASCSPSYLLFLMGMVSW